MSNAIKEALPSFGNGKSPGNDGFRAEFYAVFFNIVGEELKASGSGWRPPPPPSSYPKVWIGHLRNVHVFEPLV